MGELHALLKPMAERAIERAEGGAQLEITDTELRQALLQAIEDELRRAYDLAASA